MQIGFSNTILRILELGGPSFRGVCQLHEIVSHDSLLSIGQGGSRLPGGVDVALCWGRCRIRTALLLGAAAIIGARYHY